MKINISSLPIINIEDTFKLPKEAGVYLVLDKDKEVIYVGKTKNLYNRWHNASKSHHKMEELYLKSNLKLAYILTPNISKLEAELILYYDPCLNIALTDKDTTIKLTPAIVSQIRILKRKGMSIKNIAKRFGVSYTTVHGIINYKSWVHVPNKLPLFLAKTWRELLIIYNNVT